MEIREASARDLPALSALARQTYAGAFGGSMSAADLAHHMAASLSVERLAAELEQDTILLALAQGELIGFLQFGPPDPALSEDLPGCDLDGARELRRLYVREPCRSKGVGTRLMEAALAHTDLATSLRLYLDVWEKNEGAIRFYERYGFAVVGRRRFQVASGAETDFDLLMVRELGADRA